MTEQEIFERALDKAPEEWAAYLEAACAGDATLRRRLKALLRSHVEAGQFLGVPAVEQLAAAPPEAGTGADPLTFLAASSAPGSLGRLDHYEVLDLIGRGGTGVVLRARDTKLLRVVALKVLTASLATSGTARQRFAREARATAAVRDDHVIAIHAVQDQGPVPYLVMEFIEGQNLEALIRRGGALEVKEALRIGLQVAQGLAAAHKQGLIHRDIKPSNILLENGVQRVKLTDFGLARAADDASLTQSGIIAGTPLYMAPEQAAAEPIDSRADLFSLGSVLYELCTGRPAFRAPTTVAIIRRVCDESPRPVREINPDVPRPLCRLIERLHAKKPADRPASAQEVADLLAGLLASIQGGRPDEPVITPQGASRRLAGRTRYRLRWAAAALVLLAAGLGVGDVTGVTDVRGTVIRFVSPEGTLVVEVDDPGVSVTVDGADVIIAGAGVKEIRLKPGDYQVEASKDGKVVRRELVRVVRNGRQVVRLSKESTPLSQAEAWEESVAVLPAEQQIKAFVLRMKELNPAFDGNVAPTIQDGVVTGLKFASDVVWDLSPVRAFRSLKALDCSATVPRKGALSDLTPLRGLPLKDLHCTNTQVTDLGPLRGTPLTLLHCGHTPVSDLSPLKGLRLEVLLAQDTGVADLTPLEGMPLKWLDLALARGVSDLSSVRRMPLEYLNLSVLRVSDLSPLSDVKSLRQLVLDGTPISDLTPIRGLTLRELSLTGTRVSELGPIKSMPLKRLRLDYRADREEFLRSLTGLEFINDRPATEFWKDVAGK